MFDIQQWLAGADTSGADKSLDDEAARLLVLNHVLVDESAGPILASLIVSAEGSHGLGSLPVLARGSEPRFVAMALLNILYVLGHARSGNCEYSYNPSNDDPSQEVSLSESDLPSAEFVRTQIASVMSDLCTVFLDKVAEGDFCGDFLTYLLTILMDLAKDDASENRELETHLRSVQSQQFLKAIIRTWKTPEFSSHMVTAEHEGGLTLGFLVTCYLKCICSTTNRYGRGEVAMTWVRESQSQDEAVRGIDAIVAIDDWVIKFITMRLYQTDVSQSEREHLIAVLDECMTRSESFGKKLLELHFPSVLQHCLQLLDDSALSSPTAISEDVCSVQTKDLYPYYNILHNMCQLLGLGSAGVSSIGASYGLRQNQYPAFWSCIKILSANAMAALIRTEFASTSRGRLLKRSVISLVLKVLSLAWRVNIMQLVDLGTSSGGHAVSTPFERWLEDVYECVDEICESQQISWSTFSEAPEVAPIRTALTISQSLVDQDSNYEVERSHRNSDRNATNQDAARSICEWCLEQSQELKLCSDCQKVSYCSAEHQRAHWRSGHKTECAFLRNALPGCSFVLEDCFTISGLGFRPRQDVDEARCTPFISVERAQREELLFLAVRLPGVFSEVLYGHDGTIAEVRYATRSQVESELRQMQHGLPQDVNRRMLRACLKVANNHSILQLKERANPSLGEESAVRLTLQQVWVHFSGYDETHSLSGALQ